MKRSIRRILMLFYLTTVLLAWPAMHAAAQNPTPTGSPAEANQSSQPLVLLLTADGALTPTMAEYLERGLRDAARQNAELLIFQLNTPGGSLDLMNRMVQDIRASQVPVAVYIAPEGAMAGSAGTLITLAAHAAAMAPGTAIGAASPVGGQGEDLGQTLEAKEKNILKATARSLMTRRPPGAVTLAESMIDSAQAVSATEALQTGLIDFIATDINDLLSKLNGFQVQMAAGPQTLDTLDANVQEVRPSFIEQILQVLTNPNIIFLLIIIGVQAIIVELHTPGGWVAGFIGVVCLALALYGAGVLDVNWFGAVFIVTAFVLFILDVKAPTHGALTAAGVLSLIVGALVLFNSPSIPAFQPRVSVPLVVVMSAFTGGLVLLAVMFGVRAQNIPIQVGMESLLGRTGRAITDIKPGQRGQVQVSSEQWTAELEEGEPDIPRGTPVEIVRVKGVRVIVKRIEAPLKPSSGDEKAV